MEFKSLTSDNPLLSSRSKKQVSFPAIAFSRTPTRERHVVLQAAARTHTPVASAKKLQQADPHLRLLSPPQHSYLTPSQFDAHSLRSSRTGKQNTLNTLNTAAVPSQELVCLNHPNKVGTYETKDENNTQRFLYCEKCAILLASQGFKVSKLAKPQPLQDRNERTALRRAELSTLHELTQESMRLLDVKQEELERQEESLESLLMQQQANADEYFNRVHEIVERFRQACRAYLDEEHCQSRSVLQQLQQIAKDEKQELVKINDDVVNSDPVALKLSEERYTPVVEFYKMKLGSFRNGWKSMPADEILPRQLEFRQEGELQCLLENVFSLPSRGRQPALMISRSKKIRGRPTSVHFSFETDTHDLKLSESAIPEQNLDTTNEENLLASFPHEQ